MASPLPFYTLLLACTKCALACVWICWESGLFCSCSFLLCGSFARLLSAVCSSLKTLVFCKTRDSEVTLLFCLLSSCERAFSCKTFENDRRGNTCFPPPRVQFGRLQFAKRSYFLLPSWEGCFSQTGKRLGEKGKKERKKKYTSVFRSCLLYMYFVLKEKTFMSDYEI